MSASLLGGAIYASQRSFSGESIVYLVQGLALGIVGGPVFAFLCYLVGRNGISLIRAAVMGAVAAASYVVIVFVREPPDAPSSLAFEIGFALTLVGIGAVLGILSMLGLGASRQMS